MLRTKKAAVNPAAVMALIGILLISYLAFLPPEEKCKIIPGLDSCDGSEDDDEDSELGEDVLLSEEPGFIQPIDESADYKIGTIDLFNREVTETSFELEGNTVVEKTWFNSRTIKQEFEVNQGVNKATLFIGVQAATGLARLAVMLNGETIARFIGAGVHTVELPIDKLEKRNEIELVASTPFLPAASNKFNIMYLRVNQRYMITQGRVSRTFIIEEDIGDISSASFEFDADCYTTDPLVVKLNDKIVVNEKLCGEFKNDVRNFLEEQNELDFSSEGNYYIQDIKLKVNFKQRDYATYYFTIDKETYDKIDDGEHLAMLKMRFADEEHKQIIVYVNGKAVNIDTEKIDFKTSISRLLFKGQNSIKIVPEEAVSIGKVQIYLE